MAPNPYFAVADEAAPPGAAPCPLARILVALDASDHANQGLAEARRLAASAGGAITGIHAYAAKLHDRRFRQMEGGLPERYREEQEMERQRAVHDDLITRGLGIIGDSYHDDASLLRWRPMPAALWLPNDAPLLAVAQRLASASTTTVCSTDSAAGRPPPP